MIHVVLTMANNSSSPYFTRFAKAAKNHRNLKLSFICLFREKPDMLEEMKNLNYNCYWIKFDSNNKKKYYPYALAKSYQLLKKIKPDIIHTHLFDDSLIMLTAARMAGIRNRIISKLDAGFHFFTKPGWVKLDKLNNYNATNLITVSGENRKFIIKNENADPDKITVIHQGLVVDDVTDYSEADTEKMKQLFKIKDDEVIILNVARFVDIKGHKFIIKAAETLLKKYPHLKFLFVGYGAKKEEIANQIKQIGAEDKIILNGWIERNELNALYQLSHMYVHAAVSEPFGYVIAEAMINNLPLIATKSGVAPDVIDHKKNGYLITPEKPEEIISGIEYILGLTDEELKKLTSNAREIAMERFTLNSMWENHLRLYNQVTSRNYV